MMSRRWLLLLPLAVLIALYFSLDLKHLLTLEAIKAQQLNLVAFRNERPLLTIAGFLAAYIAVGVLPLPSAALLAVLSGALFGLFGGFLVVTFTSAIGACTGFLISRYLLRGPLSRRFASQARTIDEGIARDGLLYLASVRLVPVLPFSLINVAFGLSSMPLRSFYWVSQLGMAPGAVLFANAGRELSQLENLHDLLSPGVIASLVLVAALPWLARALVGTLRRRSSP
ncbi:MAG: pyridine nucleotide-disulfide oxidoreductase [Hydrocarboniphaga sp.]|uniref:TVP38/TMEM64 family protein n=1 Tax=Hydrocarboniphaga sp. TaxID=2033016 RepID=UPI0026275E5D|nr:VTT domain-containing protein [Hydrocarboniphaga sp.]MDB5967780.1 pyridine nucleotide-disulfide oxidoreductase [Hydrocarboniphaga sp.]